MPKKSKNDLIEELLRVDHLVYGVPGRLDALGSLNLGHNAIGDEGAAALARALRHGTPLLRTLSAAFTPVPLPLRDGVYRLVANNRYSFLGKDESGGPESCKLRADPATVASPFLG